MHNFYEVDGLPICNVCYARMKDDGRTYTSVKLKNTPCYSFLNNCKVTNGIFSVNLWPTSLTSCYRDNRIFPGSPFLFTIAAKLKENQVFRYRMIIRNNGKDYVFNTKDTRYYDREGFVSDGGIYKKFILLSNSQMQHKAISGCSIEQLLEYGILLHTFDIRFEFTVYEKHAINFNTVSNHHVGNFEYDGTTLKMADTTLRIHDNLYSVYPGYKYTLSQVNKKPSILRLDLIPDTSEDTLMPSDSEYHRALHFITEKNKKKLGAAMLERDKLKKEHDALSTKLLELTTQITTLNDL